MEIGGDADLLELADESPERVGIALFGGKPHDGGPLENSAHGFHSLKFTVAPRLHDEPEVVITDDCPRLSSNAPFQKATRGSPPRTSRQPSKY